MITNCMPQDWHSKLSGVNSFLASFRKCAYHIFMEHTELARMGGLARGKKLTKQRRKEIARMGGKAGGRGRKKVQALQKTRSRRKKAA